MGIDCFLSLEMTLFRGDYLNPDLAELKAGYLPIGGVY